MPQEYNQVVTALETITGDNLKVSFVKNRLLDEEVKNVDGEKKISHSEGKSWTAFRTETRKFTKGKQVSGGDGSFPFRCHTCGKYGHKSVNCPDAEESQGNNQRNNYRKKN